MPPDFNNTKVRGDIYHVVTGKMLWAAGGRGKDHEITSAGTYGYDEVSAPEWWREDGTKKLP